MIEPNGGKKALGGMLGFTLNRELGAADDLTVELCDCVPENIKASRIELRIDGCIEFSGIIDEAVTYENSGGKSFLSPASAIRPCKCSYPCIRRYPRKYIQDRTAQCDFSL